MSKIVLDFMWVGAEKAGSTWVADILSEHPQVSFSEPKEIQYFNKSATFIQWYQNKNFSKWIEWYEKHFLHCKKWNKIWEFSTIYLSDDTVPKLIKETYPKIKIIITLRNPIERAYSQYQMYKNYFKKEERNFQTAIENEAEYIDKWMYFKNISNYTKFFDRENILIILLDDIKKDPKKETNKIYKFLWIDTSFLSNSSNKKSNASQTVKNKFIFPVMSSFSKVLIFLRLSFLLNFLKRIWLKRLVFKLFFKKYKYEKMEEKSRKYLQEKFATDISNLEKFLWRDLSEWK